jgi:hypothetical protein
MVAQKKKVVAKKSAPKGRSSIYKGTDSSAKGGNKNLPVLGGDPKMQNRPGTQRALARANTVAADIRTKGKGLRGQVTTKEVLVPREYSGNKNRKYREFSGSKYYMGGASMTSTLKKAPKDARRTK